MMTRCWFQGGGSEIIGGPECEATCQHCREVGRWGAWYWKIDRIECKSMLCEDQPGVGSGVSISWSGVLTFWDGVLTSGAVYRHPKWCTDILEWCLDILEWCTDILGFTISWMRVG